MLERLCKKKEVILSHIQLLFIIVFIVIFYNVTGIIDSLFRVSTKCYQAQLFN